MDKSGKLKPYNLDLNLACVKCHPERVSPFKGGQEGESGLDTGFGARQERGWSTGEFWDLVLPPRYLLLRLTRCAAALTRHRCHEPERPAAGTSGSAAWDPRPPSLLQEGLGTGKPGPARSFPQDGATLPAQHEARGGLRPGAEGLWML